MSALQSTRKRRSAVTGSLPQLDSGSRLVWIGFAGARIAAAIVVRGALNNPNSFAERSDWITHIQTVLEVLGVARGDTLSALTSTQEYFRSGDPKRLDGLVGNDLSWLQRQTAALRNLTSDNPAQQRRVDELDRLVGRLVTLGRLVKQMALTHTLAQIAAEPQSVGLSSGLGEAARTLREMTAEEDRLMKLRTEAVHMVSRRSLVATTAGTLLIFWLLVIGLCNIRISRRAHKSSEDLAASREKLQKLSATLEQRVAERTAALLERISLVSSIFQSVPEAMMTRTKEGIITSWNPGAERLFGYTAEEIIGKSARVLMPEGERWLVDPGAGGDEHRASQTSEARRLAKDGTVIEVVVTVAAIRCAEGQLTGYAVIYHDNTKPRWRRPRCRRRTSSRSRRFA